MSAQDQIRETIEKNDVVLFMKGTKMMPQCGFSSRVAGVLNFMGIDYQDVNVLADAEIRHDARYPGEIQVGGYRGERHQRDQRGARGQLTHPRSFQCCADSCARGRRPHQDSSTRASSCRCPIRPGCWRFSTPSRKTAKLGMLRTP